MGLHKEYSGDNLLLMHELIKKVERSKMVLGILDKSVHNFNLVVTTICFICKKCKFYVPRISEVFHSQIGWVNIFKKRSSCFY